MIWGVVMSHRSRWEYFRAVYARYRQADRGLKQTMLNEFCANTGYNRKYAIRLLTGPPPERVQPRLRRHRSPRYGSTVVYDFPLDKKPPPEARPERYSPAIPQTP